MFFCLICSSCIRLSCRGKTGPKSLKPYEALSQLEQFEGIDGEDWMEVSQTLKTFINKTISLLIISNMKIKQILKPLHLTCDICKKTEKVTEDTVSEIDTGNIESFGPISVEYILKRYINNQDSFQCNHDLDLLSLEKQGRLVIFSFSNPITFDIQERIMLWGKVWEYKGHIEESVKKQEDIAYFKYGKQMFFQENNKELNSAAFGTHYNVKILALIVTPGNEQEVINSSNLVYNSKVQLKLHKKLSQPNSTSTGVGA